MGNRRDTRSAPSRVRSLFSFPNPVNEVSARLVAAGVVVMCVLTIAFDLRWATIVIAYGFVARVLTGPTLSPLGQFVTRVVTPRLGIAERPVAGAAQALRPGHGRRLLGDRAGADRPRLLDRGRGRARPPGHGGVPRVRLRPVPRVQDVRRPHARAASCPKRSASAATTSGARTARRPEPRRAGSRAQLS